MSRLTIFSDLDGTLLDHESYSHAAASEALALLRRRGDALVLASSKTAAEIAPLRAELGFAHVPAIVENGSGVLAAGASDADGHDHARLLQALNAVPADVRGDFHGFTAMGIDWIVEQTGLSTEAAELAARRRYSEPGLWMGHAQGEAAFQAALAENGVVARRGGRFLTLSFGATKADHMAQIARDTGAEVTLALGDAANDVEMIKAADFGVVIANPHNAPLPPLPGEATGRVIRSKFAGPKGWNRAVLNFIETGLRHPAQPEQDAQRRETFG